MTSPYPYTRREECSWHPEDAARHLACLALSNNHASASLDNNNVGIHTNNSTSSASASASTQLLSHGWSTRQIETLRRLYGTNSMQGDKGDAAGQARGISMDRYAPCLSPIGSALLSQLKEPLILMLLGSAGISVIMGNKADAISIGIALLIVSFVAAVQEYRSEQALEKLANLVPHTCTVLRGGQVNDHFLARELVVGDLVLLATGE
jgi:Ca2+-transporting ATPase